MLKVKAGDVEKLGLLYKRYSRRLFGFFYRMTSSASVSEDLVQNVFMRMLKYKHSYSDSGNFEAWALYDAEVKPLEHIKPIKGSCFEEAERIASNWCFLRKHGAKWDQNWRELIHIYKHLFLFKIKDKI